MPTLELPEAAIRYESETPASAVAGAPVVLVHGGFCDSADWRHQRSGLLARGHRVVTLDLRGHGLSPTSDPNSCTVQQMATDLLEVMRASGVGPAVVVGHSLGCRIALESARQDPTAASGLVLVDGSRLGSSARNDDQQAILEAARTQGAASVLEHLFEQMFVGRVDPAVRAHVLDRLPGMDERVVTALMSATITWDARALEEALDCVVVDVLAIQSSWTELDGTRRSLTSSTDRTPWHDLLAAHLRCFRVEIVTGVGHFCMLEEPEQVTTSISRFARDAIRSDATAIHRR